MQASPRVRLNPWRGLATAPGFHADSACTSPNIACRRSRQASHRVRSSSRRMPARISIPRSRIGAAPGPAPARWRRRRALAPTVEALPLMVCRVAALPWTSALAELAFELGEEVLHVRNEAPQHGRSARGAAETPGDIAPRLDQFARVRCRCRRAHGAAPAEMTEQSTSAPCRSASPHGRSCPRRQAASRSASEALAVMARIGSPAKRPSARILRVASRPSISGICMSISTASNGTLASSTC